MDPENLDNPGNDDAWIPLEVTQFRNINESLFLSSCGRIIIETQ